MNPIEISRSQRSLSRAYLCKLIPSRYPRETRGLRERGPALENITRVTEPPRDFACEYFQIREYAKSLEASGRGARGGCPFIIKRNIRGFP